MRRTTKALVELFQPRSWNPKVKSVVSRLVPSEVRACLKRMPADDMYADTMAYLQSAYAAAGYGYDESAPEMLAEEVLGQFAFLRGFHGCRPLSLATYKSEGLVTLTPPRLAAYAHAIFQGTLPLPDLQHRAERADLTTRSGKIYFCADSNFLVSECGHYLIYGPESLCCLWGDTPHDSQLFYQCRQRSRDMGIPTIFVCDVPIEFIQHAFRSELGRTLLTWHFQLTSDKPLHPGQWSRNWGFAITRDLPANYIRGHFHPGLIPDPFHWGQNYRNSSITCDWCQPGLECAASRPFRAPSS